MSPLGKVGIVGAGVMGPGIAEVFAVFGPDPDLSVTLYDPVPEALAKAKLRLGSDFLRFHQAGLIERDSLESCKNRIRLVTELDLLRDAELVIEAVPECLEVKQEVFRKLDRLLPESSILATNSSGLSISEIAAVTRRPALCIGTHFLNPPFLMPLVEVVKGRETAETTVNLVMELLASVHKRPVLVRKDVAGYVLNRLQAAVFRELMFLLETGVMTVPDLEATVRYGFGLRLPIIKVFELVDIMGLDTIQNVFAYLFPTLDCSVSPPGVIARMVRRGELGVKSGKGFHDYTRSGVLESMQKKQAAIVQLTTMMKQFD